MDREDEETTSPRPDIQTALCLRAPKMNGDGTFGIIGSDETMDSFDSVLRVKGWDLTRFSGKKNGGVPSKKGSNPVIMWAHNYDIPPIGLATRVAKNLGSSPTLDFDVRFSEEEEFGGEGWPDTAPNPTAIRSMVEAGILRGSSVGFYPGEFKALEIGDGERAHSFGFFEPRDYFKGHELLELSMAPIPSNPAALVRAFSEAWITRRHLPMILASLELCKRSLNVASRGLGDDLVELVQREVGAPRTGVELPGIGLAPCIVSNMVLEHDPNTLETCKDPSNYQPALNAMTVRGIVREEIRSALALEEDEEPEEPVADGHSKASSNGQRQALADLIIERGSTS